MRRVAGTLDKQARVLGSVLAVLWAVFLVNVILHGRLLEFGVIPRTVIGLRGIALSPFLHGSLQHLVANSVSFVVLGWLVLLRGTRAFTRVTIVAALASGTVAWLLGAGGSVHIGASGVIFGYLGYLMLSGWFTRSIGTVLLSLIVTVMWGGLVLGVLPGAPGVSWQAHLGGFVGGVIAAGPAGLRRR